MNWRDTGIFMGPSLMANFDFWSSIIRYHWKISVYLMINRVYKFSKFSIGKVYGITSSFVPGGLNDVCLNWNTVFRSKYDPTTTLLSKTSKYRQCPRIAFIVHVPAFFGKQAKLHNLLKHFIALRKRQILCRCQSVSGSGRGVIFAQELLL